MNGEGRVPFARVLVTGGSGFVGRTLLPALRHAAGCDGLGAIETIVAGRGPDCDVLCDMARPETVTAAVAAADPDVIVHLAGEASVAVAANTATETWRSNASGVLEMAAAFGRCRPRGLFFFTSSAEIYGDALRDGAATERTVPVPNTVYGRSKLAAEHILADVLPATARLIVVRPSNHIGPNQDERFAVPAFARQLVDAERAGVPARIEVGNLTAIRDFMDVRDVVQAYIRLLAIDLPAGARETFNIASGTVRTVGAVLDMLRAQARIGSEVVVDPARFRTNETSRAEIDAGRLRGMTNWAPRFPLEQSLRDVLDTMRASAPAAGMRGSDDR